MLFLAYAVLNGIVFSTYFLIFEVVSLILIFAATAVYFGAMAAYGCFNIEILPFRIPAAASFRRFYLLVPPCPPGGFMGEKIFAK